MASARDSISIFVISPDPNETFFAERNFLSFRDRVQLLQGAYRSATKLIKEQFPHLQARFASRGVSISLAKFENRMKERLEQLENFGAEPGNGSRVVKSPIHHPVTGAS